MDTTVKDVISNLHKKSIIISEKINELEINKTDINEIDITYLEEMCNYMNYVEEYVDDLKILLKGDDIELPPNERIRIKHIKNINKVQKFFVPYITLLTMKLDSE